LKFNLLIKYILIYAATALLGFLCVTFISYRVDYNKVSEYYDDSLYRQAIAIADEYASDYFSSEHLRVIETELNTISKLNDTRIMFVDTFGNVILDTEYTGTADEHGILYTLYGFDYTSLGTKHSVTGDFYGTFDSKTLSVFAPIVNIFSTKGYVVIHLDDSKIQSKVYTTFNTNYLTLAIMLLFNLAFIGLYVIHIHNPLTRIIKGTDEYGKGNLSYKISVRNNDADEIGRLAASLNYMASKLDESDQFQQKFLSNISHDFRSPLTSIKGYLEAISDGTIPPEMQKKYIDIVLFETDRLTKLTSNILTLNELDPETVRLEISVFDINSIIRHTIETFEGNCKKKNIRFHLTFSAEKEYVRADKSKIGQVIYNLVDNAIKFSHENSFIYISVREKGEKAYISVKDMGSGISKDSLSKIWDRFYKSDSSRGRDKKGSGLGLSITKEIIQAHNEHIDVISTEGVGTEFTFTLPVTRRIEQDKKI
jgi:signal transduction histidine kinase